MSRDSASDKPMFERMGTVYKLLVDEDARRRREEPMLLRIADEARAAGARRKRPAKSTRIIDLACGTGFHARILSDAGYRVEAMDASESLLDQARRLSGDGRGTRFARADLLEPLPVSRPAALALLLGNTLSLFPEPARLRRVLAHVADALVPGGLLLCQILNFERLRREGPITTVRHGTVEGRETNLTKVLQPADDGTILIHLSAAQREPKGEWETFSKASVMNALDPRALRRAAHRSGLQVVSEWGTMTGDPVAPSSPDYVALFRRDEELRR